MIFKRLVYLNLYFLLSLKGVSQSDSSLFLTQVLNNPIEDSLITSNSIYDLSLSQLLDLKVEITGNHELSLRETPGIVTIITENDIQVSGARDMQDILRLVPGFELAGDVENSVSLGIRGNWAMEGKILFMIDGLQVNETGFGSIIFGNRFLLDNIKKIEIIRGPGSAIYGGSAELAVINISTKSGINMEGGYLSTSYGNSNQTTSRINSQFGIGTITSNKLNISLTGAASSSNRSNETAFYYTNPSYTSNGESTHYNYADSSKINNLDLNLGIKYKGLEFKTIYQQYDNELNNSNANWVQFGGIYTGLKYKWNLTDKLSLIPALSWKKENPWSYKGNVSEEYLYYNSINYRSVGNLNALYDISKNLSVNIGGEIQQDQAKRSNDTILFANNKTRVNYSNYAFFGEFKLTSKLANLILGARYDKHSQFGDAFVPRFAITKAWKKAHIKAILSRAFRAPVINNFELNSEIKPEFTNVAEIELGYILSNHNAIIGNLFYIQIENPIIYNDADYSYFNGAITSTIGFELIHKSNYKWGYFNSSYSFYKNNNTQEQAYLVENNPNLLKAFPAHKVITSGGIYIRKKITFSPTIIYNSEKGGTIYRDEYYENYGPVTYKSSLSVNCILHYDLINSLKLSLGAYDILGTNYTATNSYDPGYTVPLMGREFILKAMYKF